MTIAEQIDYALNDNRIPARQRLELADKLLTQLLDLVGALRQEVKSEVRG